MLGETEIYNLLPVCPSTALITAVPHGQSQYRPESPFKDFHRNMCAQEEPAEGFPYSRLCGGGVFGNTEFYLDFCSPLCKCLIGSGSWQRKCGGRWLLQRRESQGAAERVTSHLWGKGCAKGTQVWSLWLFLSFQFTWFYICMCISERKQKSAWLWKTGEKNES